jgi:hypothetical protein
VVTVAGAREERVPERLVARLLREWRDAERKVAAAPAGTPEHDAAQVEADRLRLAYHEAERALRELIRAGEVEPRQPPPPSESPEPREPKPPEPPEG